MTLFDLHTHNSTACKSSAHKCLAILNTLPSDYDNAIFNDVSSFFSCGIHPWYSDDWKRQMKLLKEISTHNKLVAIGEAGLDRLRGVDLALQIEIFSAQIVLSESIKKPLIIHCVRAWDVLLSIYQEMKPTQSWIVHGFRGKPALAKQLLDKGMYISIGEYYNPQTVIEIPIDRLFCETDESSLSIFDVYTNVSQTLGLSIEMFAEQMDINRHSLFPNVE